MTSRRDWDHERKMRRGRGRVEREARDRTKRTKREYVTKMAPLCRKGKLGDGKQNSGTGERFRGGVRSTERNKASGAVILREQGQCALLCAKQAPQPVSLGPDNRKDIISKGRLLPGRVQTD